MPLWNQKDIQQNINFLYIICIIKTRQICSNHLYFYNLFRVKTEVKTCIWCTNTLHTHGVRKVARNSTLNVLLFYSYQHAVIINVKITDFSTLLGLNKTWWKKKPPKTQGSIGDCRFNGYTAIRFLCSSDLFSIVVLPDLAYIPEAYKCDVHIGI